MRRRKRELTRIHLGPCSSTQEFLQEHLNNLMEDFPVCITCDSQTRGKGRKNRGWHSPSGLGLYMSWGFRMESRRMLHWIPLAVGVAICETLERYAPPPVLLKWPNDVLVSGRKIAGILSESRVFSDAAICCCGIGINLNHSPADFPPSLQKDAISLAMVTNRNHTVEDILPPLCSRLTHWHDRLERGSSRGIQAAAKRRMRWMFGSRVTFHQGNSIIQGIAHGISVEGGLILEPADGSPQTFFSGEVQMNESPL